MNLKIDRDGKAAILSQSEIKLLFSQGQMTLRDRQILPNYALKSGRRQGRVNMIAAYCNGQLFAPFTVEGSRNRTVFETWLLTCLIPTLKPGQIVIADNATFHKGGQIQELIEAAGCQLKYLPSYSPDLNKIERCWSWLKSRIRKQIIQFCCLRDAMEAVQRKSDLTALAVAIVKLQTLTPES